MSRAEMRRQAKMQAKATATYNLTRAQLDEMLAAERKKGQDEAIDHAFLFMLGVPLNVLYHDYWKDEAKELAPEFARQCFALFEALQEGIVSHEEIADLIEELTGASIQASWLNRKEKET